MWEDTNWPIFLAVLIVGGFFLWRLSRTDDPRAVASSRLQHDIRLYERIRSGMQEYDLRTQKQRFGGAANGQLLFETANMSVFHVDHPMQNRVGFHFKDTNEYGMYGFLAGDGDDFQESYYRSDRGFIREALLLFDDE